MQPSARFILSWVLVLGFLLSGCAAKPVAHKSSFGQEQGTARTADAFGAADGAETGEIAGRVIDDEFRPLGGAIVSIIGSQVKTTTTEDGIFFFSKVPVRTYTLQVTKPGYDTKNQSVPVAANQRAIVAVTLRQLLDLTPYRDTGFVFKGTIHCSARANTSGTNTNPECGQTQGDKDVERRTFMDLLPGIRAILIEVQWQSGLPAVNDQLILAVRPYQGPSWRQVQGKSPIQTMITPQDWASILKFSEKDYPKFGGQLEFFMMPGEAAKTDTVGAGVAAEQTFTIYATAWYRMDAEPGFSRLPKA